MPWGDALDTGHSSRSPCHGELALASDRPPISHGDGHELQTRNLSILPWGKAGSTGLAPLPATEHGACTWEQIGPDSFAVTDKPGSPKLAVSKA